MRRGGPLARQVMDMKCDRKDLYGEFSETNRVGVILIFRVKTPSAPRTYGYPRNPHHSSTTVQKLRKDVTNGRMFAFPNQKFDDDPITATPSALVLGKLPDRTIPIDMRRIADIRIANQSCANYDYHMTQVPQLKDLA